MQKFATYILAAVLAELDIPQPVWDEATANPSWDEAHIISHSTIFVTMSVLEDSIRIRTQVGSQCCALSNVGLKCGEELTGSR